MSYAIFVLAFLGHIALWAALWNRAHSMRLHFRTCQILSGAMAVATLSIPLAIAVFLLVQGQPGGGTAARGVLFELPIAVRAYLFLCLAVPPIVVLQRLAWRLRNIPRSLRESRNEYIDLRPAHRSARGRIPQRVRERCLAAVGKPASAPGIAAGPTPVDRQAHTRPLAPRNKVSPLLTLPGNESLRLQVTHLELQFDALPPELDGLTVCHLTDWHFTGRVDRAYYDAVVDRANALQPDLVALTGDLVDHEEELPTAADVMSRLQARLGVYFILGNHDLRVGARRVRQALVERGLLDLGGRAQFIEYNGAEFALAGNEMPWLGPAPRVPQTDGRPDRGLFRLGLAHTPDAVNWAIREKVHLLLAGHTHGGQVCVPGFGPLLTPCCSGIRHARGLYEYRPTVLYVNRGVSGQFPVRYFCPPELAQITLRCGSATSELKKPAAVLAR